MWTYCSEVFALRLELLYTMPKLPFKLLFVFYHSNKNQALRKKHLLVDVCVRYLGNPFLVCQVHRKFETEAQKLEHIRKP